MRKGAATTGGMVDISGPVAAKDEDGQQVGNCADVHLPAEEITRGNSPIKSWIRSPGAVRPWSGFCLFRQVRLVFLPAGAPGGMPAPEPGPE
jgi:hypothetical protein